MATPFQITGAESVATILALCVIYIPPFFVVSPQLVLFYFLLVIVFLHSHHVPHSYIHRPLPAATPQTTLFWPPPTLLIMPLFLCIRIICQVYPPNDVALPRSFDTCNGCNLLSLHPNLSYFLPSIIILSLSISDLVPRFWVSSSYPPFSPFVSKRRS